MSKCRVFDLCSILSHTNRNDEVGVLKHTTLTAFIDELTLMYEHRSTSRTRVSPRLFKQRLLKELQSIKEGDIIDIHGYRGLGYYYVYEKYNRLYVKATLHKDHYGYHLPHQAFKQLLVHGIEYFDHADVHYCQIPLKIAEKQLWWRNDGMPELYFHADTEENIIIADVRFHGCSIQHIPFRCHCGR